MRFAMVMLAAFALLLAGCASAPQQQAPVAPPAAVPQAPENNVAPTIPPGASAAPATCMAGSQAMKQGKCDTVISLAQLATHSTEADCWIGYDAEVYDITTYIPKHKNYQALIVPLCGSSDQFKAKFEGKHGLSKVSILEAQPLKGLLGQ